MNAMSLHKVFSVWFATTIVWIISLTEIEAILKVLAAAIAVGYGLWRWRRDYKKEKTKK